MTAPKPRVILNASLAAEIYKEKLALLAPTSFESCLKDTRFFVKGKSAKLSAKYGVSAKTIRDIWNGRTWTSATSSLWRSRNSIQEVSFSPFIFMFFG
jgi:hypothetical protein